MNVEIDDGDAVDGAALACPFSGNGEIVEDAEAGAFTTKCVVRSSGNGSGDAGVERSAGGRQRSTGACQGSLHETLRPGKADAAEDGVFKRPTKEALDVCRGVHPQQILFGGERGCGELEARVGVQPVAHHTVFRERELVTFGQREGVVVAEKQGQPADRHSIARIAITRMPIKIPAWAALAALCLAVIYFVVLGPWRAMHGVYSFDLASNYGAARVWAAGLNPYDMQLVTQQAHKGGYDLGSSPNFLPIQPSVYPPTVFPLMVLFSWLPWEPVRLIWACLSPAVFAWSLSVFFLDSKLRDSSVEKWLLLAGAFCFSPTFLGIAHGNPSALACGLTTLAIYWGIKGRGGQAAFALGIVHCLKPQISIAAVLLFGLWRYWRPLLLSFVYPTVALLVSFLRAPSLSALGVWMSSLQQALAGASARGHINDPSPANEWGSYSMANLQTIFACGVHNPRVVNLLSWMVAAVLAALYLRYRREVQGDKRLQDMAFVSALTLTFVYHRFYDEQLLLLAVPFLLALGRDKKGLANALWACLFLLAFPLHVLADVVARRMMPTSVLGMVMLRPLALIVFAMCLLLIPWRRRVPLSLLKTTTFLLLMAGTSYGRDVTIIRDDWGIAHVYGKTDADAVFGMVYAQAEDDFNRVETNYLNAMGRLAEAEGESKVFQDLRMKLFIDPDVLKKEYTASPVWLRKLMDAFADGLNEYLARHPEVRPRVIQRFEPWMALSFTEGSIGGDIERVDLKELEAFYGQGPVSAAEVTGEREPSGSNGMAIAPQNTASHHALLLINPHTSFFFRSELQMVSEEGLDAYGAVTWGQFFVYQGFNDRVGWMHTSSGVDAVDEYVETIVKKDGRLYYKYGTEERPVVQRKIIVPYRTEHGRSEKTFSTYRTQHGPVIRQADGKWVSIRLMQEPSRALMQSYLRTKARDYNSYRKTMELQANSSNNTVFADTDGDIAYFHGNFIPRRDGSFDWTKPVDGSNPATEWRGLLSIDETPHLLNPASGWLYNTNNWPWSAAGASSPKREDYPAYVETGTESARGLHALRVLEGKKDFTLDTLIGAAYDSYLPWFDKPLPALVKAWDAAAEGDRLKERLRAQIGVLRGWDQRWGVTSVATSLAVFWGEEMRGRAVTEAKKEHMLVEDYVAGKVPGEQLLTALAAASDKLAADFGSWQTRWGDINRFQRLNGDIEQPFNDGKPSTPVGFTSAVWGSLASFGAKPYPGTKKWYGTGGNSFVAVVEFGDKVRAKAVSAGGESGHPESRHFDDQGKRYCEGDLRDVYFYRSDLQGHIEREYHPGN